MPEYKVWVSELDTSRFGFVCVRADHIKKANISDALEFCRMHNARVMIARCATSDIDTARSLEDNGFRIADTLVYLAIDYRIQATCERPSVLPVRPFQPSDTEQIVQAARAIFANYVNHYRADRSFDPDKVEEIYTDWTRRSCANRTVAQEILVADDRGEVAGFVTLRLNDDEEGELVIGGVVPRHRGKGLYRELLLAGAGWCNRQGRPRMVISTQVNNHAAQRACARAGLLPSRSVYTFHKWF